MVVTNVLKERTASLFMEETPPRIKNKFLENLVNILFGKTYPVLGNPKVHWCFHKSPALDNISGYKIFLSLTSCV
jgi:hypothetical protein